MTRSAAFLALWTLLAGAGIPLIGVLNSGMARALGNPFAATALMFGIAFLVAFGLTLAFYGLPGLGQFGAAPAISYGAGLLIGFYALSATIIIPRFGTGSFVAFILIAQLVTAAIVDQFGLFGMTRHPLNGIKLAGFALIMCGIALVQLVGSRNSAG